MVLLIVKFRNVLKQLIVWKSSWNIEIDSGAKSNFKEKCDAWFARGFRALFCSPCERVEGETGTTNGSQQTQGYICFGNYLLLH